MNIIFMGTPEFAVPSLKALINEFGVKAVLTQPDKPKGRGKKMAMSPVKEVALEHNIPVFQPLKVKNNLDLISSLREIEPDFIIVVAYGQILPKEILEMPKYGCINLHASLLPKYRGAAPINWSIIDGEAVSGNTTMLMDIGLDTGNMLLKDEVKIEEQTTAGELHDILKERGARLLLDTINGLVDSKIIPKKQEESQTCYASMLNKEMACINWDNNSKDIHNLIRGLNPWPTAYTYYKGSMMKIFKSKVLNKKKNSEPGIILEVSKEGIEVSTGDGALLIEEVQFPNGKPLKVCDYINGNSIDIGEKLGNN